MFPYINPYKLQSKPFTKNIQQQHNPNSCGMLQNLRSKTARTHHTKRTQTQYTHLQVTYSYQKHPTK